MDFKEAVKAARDGEFVAREGKAYTVCSLNGISLHNPQWVEEYVEVFKRPYCDGYHENGTWDAGYSPWIEDVLADDWHLVDWEWETGDIEPFVKCVHAEYVERFGCNEKDDSRLIEEWKRRGDGESNLDRAFRRH